MLIDLKPPAWAAFLLSDLTDWKRQPLPVAEVRPYELPDDVYFEYAWRDAAGELHPDPANTNPRLNPWWDHACNLTGPDYEPEPHTLALPGRPRGRVLGLDLQSKRLGQKRRLMIYSPPGRAEDELPVVLFQDGKAYYGWGRAAQVFDRLLERDEVEPAHLVFIPPVRRTEEYAFNPRYRAFLIDEALPYAESRARCDGRRTAWGASLGGLLSAQLAWERPDLFRNVVTQSGAYLFSEDMDRENPFAGNEDFVRAVRAASRRELRWHLQCGSLEWMLPSNENLAAALDERGYQAVLVRRSAGHNWVNWRNGLADGFRFALGDGS